MRLLTNTVTHSQFNGASVDLRSNADRYRLMSFSTFRYEEHLTIKRGVILNLQQNTAEYSKIQPCVFKDLFNII